MKKIIVFGAGAYGRRFIGNCPNNFEIVAVCDNNDEKCKMVINGHKIVSPSVCQRDAEFDYIFICMASNTRTYFLRILEIYEQLRGLGVSDEKIVVIPTYDDYWNDTKNVPFEYPRVQFLHDFAQMVYDFQIPGAVAECGVCFGDFASHISQFFPDRKLYLFDTFEGFPAEDIALEDKRRNKIVYKRLSGTRCSRFLDRSGSAENVESPKRSIKERLYSGYFCGYRGKGICIR